MPYGIRHRDSSETLAFKYLNQTSDCRVQCVNPRRDPEMTVYSEKGVETVLVQQLGNMLEQFGLLH